jgi:DNA topoisomerase-3
MSKSVYIAEKPSVAQEFAKALHEDFKRRDGFLESEQSIVTWCVGHLVTMSYPESYDPKLKRWSLDTLPFLPKEFKYEVIPDVSKQFETVKHILTRPDVDTIYVCTDSGREGEYIYRLVEQMSGVTGKNRKRVWIDSQTEEEIHRGIETAKDLSAYDNLAESAYLRAKEDYLMGINFSRLLTLKYGRNLASYLKKDRVVVSVGRVMTCVLGMVVRREREVRDFVKTPFYRVIGTFTAEGKTFDAEWRAVEGSRYFNTPFLYKENGFKESKKAQELIDFLNETQPVTGLLEQIENKKETKNPPLLYNLAELQNDCSRMFKISPDETLKIVQELYEKKLVTYPRTDARVLSTAVCKEIQKNISGLRNYAHSRAFAEEILQSESFRNIANTRYCNDKQITDHYAIIPTGQGFGNLRTLSQRSENVYEIIVRRFLSIFYPPAVYRRYALTVNVKNEKFFASFRVLETEGYLKVSGNSAYSWKKEDNDDTEDVKCDMEFLEVLKKLKKGAILGNEQFIIKEGETSPPKRYSSGSMILAMENAGQLIEDEELRAQIKGSGIGTSATRAEILKKLNTIGYIQINQKTQLITPTLMGEMIYEVVNMSIRHLLNPELTASWEKGLTYVAEGTITSGEYMEKLEHFIVSRTNGVLKLQNQSYLYGCFDAAAQNYK